ncbi:MAG TPA: hypothetical protein VK177_08855 [Flavobacteriales bacterium]|nr:hypothetical protein [Flavobacteriales bacterium]
MTKFTRNPVAFSLLLGLFFSVVLVQCKLRESKSKTVSEQMVVVNIIEGTIGESHNKVMFQKSQRIYRIAKNAKKEYHELLYASKEKGLYVTIVRNSEDDDEILKVKTYIPGTNQ